MHYSLHQLVESRHMYTTQLVHNHYYMHFVHPIQLEYVFIRTDARIIMSSEERAGQVECRSALLEP